jgi:hypothetical protein
VEALVASKEDTGVKRPDPTRDGVMRDGREQSDGIPKAGSHPSKFVPNWTGSNQAEHGVWDTLAQFGSDAWDEI